MSRTHGYDVSVTWTGNRGTGTSGYRAYGRDHDVTSGGLPPIAASSDPAFRGDPGRWNPELELTAALAQCHMLWYLHLCATAGVVVTAYADQARGAMAETADGGGSSPRSCCGRGSPWRPRTWSRPPRACTRRPTPSASSRTR